MNHRPRLFILAIILIYSFAVKAESKKYLEYDIEYNENMAPIVHLPVNGELVPLIIDTGALGMGLSLDGEVISRFSQLVEVGVDRYIDLTGKASDVKQYKLSSLDIEGLKFKNVVVNEYYPWGLYSDKSTNYKSQYKVRGVIGVQLLRQFPIILDYVNNKLFILSSSDVVPGELYDKKDWRKIHFGINSNGIEFSASFGSNNLGRLDLDTASTISIIKPSLVPQAEIMEDCELNFPGEDKCRYYLSKDLKLDNISFGPQSFIIYNFSEPSSAGILGADFLAGKIVFFDFNKKIMLVK